MKYLRQYEARQCICEPEDCKCAWREDNDAGFSSPFVALEKLLQKKVGDSQDGEPVVKPIHVKELKFMAIKYAFDEMQKDYSQGAMPNFEASKLIDEGKNHIDVLRAQSRWQPSDLITFIEEGLQARAEYYDYLEDVEDKGSKQIDEKTEKAKANLKLMYNELDLALKASNEASIPQHIQAKADEYNYTLRLKAVQQKKRSKKQMVPKPAEGDEEAPIFEDMPQETFRVAVLRARRVVCRLNLPVSKEEDEAKLLEQLSLTFRASEDGSWDVEITKKERDSVQSILEFTITVGRLQQMKGAGKTARISFGGMQDDFIVLQAFIRYSF